MISFEEGQGGHYILAAYQSILEGILFQARKRKQQTEEWQAATGNEPSFASLLRTKSLRLSQGK